MYTRMLFGAKNASAVYKGMMDTELTLPGLPAVAVSFIDDLLVHSQSGAQHAIDVGLDVAMLIRCGLRAHPWKTFVVAETVEYLGHMVPGHGLNPTQAKVLAITRLPKPSNADKLR